MGRQAVERSDRSLWPDLLEFHGGVFACDAVHDDDDHQLVENIICVANSQLSKRDEDDDAVKQRIYRNLHSQRILQPSWPVSSRECEFD